MDLRIIIKGTNELRLQQHTDEDFQFELPPHRFRNFTLVPTYKEKTTNRYNNIMLIFDLSVRDLSPNFDKYDVYNFEELLKDEYYPEIEPIIYGFLKDISLDYVPSYTSYDNYVVYSIKSKCFYFKNKYTIHIEDKGAYSIHRKISESCKLAKYKSNECVETYVDLEIYDNPKIEFSPTTINIVPNTNDSEKIYNDIMEQQNS